MAKTAQDAAVTNVPSGDKEQDVKRWARHVLRAGPAGYLSDEEPGSGEFKRIEPWLSALLQAEHLNLLVGTGLTTAIALRAGVTPVDMAPVAFNCRHAGAVGQAAATTATRSGRGEPNFEDQIRAALELVGGLQVLAGTPRDEAPEDDVAANARELLGVWQAALNTALTGFLASVLKTEEGIRDVMSRGGEAAITAARLLGSFLLAFASRTATRERLHIFTTNYDRLIEFGADLLGLRILDRFVGGLSPVFRSSRLGVDLHYNPPGIRGEPRYLEGVVRLTKLHGSVDWRQETDERGRTKITRSGVPFGAPANHPDLPKAALDGLVIYPNPAKDMETLLYPYAELFRDFAGATCQPNAVLVTYGYGFGDDHINRVIADMLTIPSTHLAIISFDEASGRIRNFCDGVGRNEQLTLLIGPHFGDLGTLVRHYLPKPAIDKTTQRMVELLNRRVIHETSTPLANGTAPAEGGDQ